MALRAFWVPHTHRFMRQDRFPVFPGCHKSVPRERCVYTLGLVRTRTGDIFIMCETLYPLSYKAICPGDGRRSDRRRARRKEEGMEKSVETDLHALNLP